MREPGWHGMLCPLCLLCPLPLLTQTSQAAHPRRRRPPPASASWRGPGSGAPRAAGRRGTCAAGARWGWGQAAGGLVVAGSCRCTKMVAQGITLTHWKRRCMRCSSKNFRQAAKGVRVGRNIRSHRPQPPKHNKKGAAPCSHLRHEEALGHKVRRLRLQPVGRQEREDSLRRRRQHGSRQAALPSTSRHAVWLFGGEQRVQQGQGALLLLRAGQEGAAEAQADSQRAQHEAVAAQPNGGRRGDGGRALARKKRGQPLPELLTDCNHSPPRALAASPSELPLSARGIGEPLDTVRSTSRRTAAHGAE